MNGQDPELREKIWHLVLDFSYKNITLDKVTDQIIALFKESNAKLEK